jgi:hypothetical protein
MGPQSRRSPNFGNFETPKYSHLGVLGQNAIWMWASWRGIEYIIMGEGDGFPQVRAMVNLVNSSCPWFVLAPKVLQLCTNYYNNRGLFCDPNIIANNKEKSFQKPAVANHNSSQTLKLLRYHNIRTRIIASPSQLRNLIQSQNFPIIVASIHCLRLTLHQKLFATHPSPQRLSESTQKSIGLRYNI